MNATRMTLICLFLFTLFLIPRPTLATESPKSSAVQFRLDSLEYQEINNLRLANAFIYWGNTSPYEIHDLVATVHLYNKDGKIISATPMVVKETTMEPSALPLGHGEAFQFELVKGITKATDLEGAYINPSLTFMIGKKALPETYIEAKALVARYQNDHLHVETVLYNHGDATAKNFDWKAITIVWPQEEHVVSYENKGGKRHSVINDSLVLEPGHFVKASFDIPMQGRTEPLPSPDDLYVDVSADHVDTPPYREELLQIIVNNQRVTSTVLIENGTSYIPLRDFAEALGATVSWDESTESVMMKKGNVTLRTTVGSPSYHLNDRVLTGAVAKLHNNTTFVVPLRLVAEQFDCEIIYDQKWEKEMIIVIPRTA